LPLDPLIITGIIVVVVVIACAAIVIFAMRRRGKKKPPKEPEILSEPRISPFKVTKSVPSSDATHAKDELRILDLEREILSDAIRKLYEAHAEGKITEQERERLAQTYKARMMTIKEAISKDESLVALHELETMQEDLMKLFSERFDDLNAKIGELRSKTDLKPVKEVTITSKLEEAETETSAEEKTEEGEKAKKKRKPSTPRASSPRTEAEKRIEEIRSEVEKVLDRLGQMEIES
jgi:hypothetical protein